MTEEGKDAEGGWEQVVKDPIYRDVAVIALVCALGFIMFSRQMIRMPEGAITLGQGMTCTVLFLVLVIILVFIMWRVRIVRTDAIKRSLKVPWMRVTKTIEEVLKDRTVEYEREVRGWRGPSYTWTSGRFRQVYHLPREHLRIYVESRDARGTGKLGHPTELSVGPVNDGTRAFVDGLTDWLDEALADTDDIR